MLRSELLPLLGNILFPAPSSSHLSIVSPAKRLFKFTSLLGSFDDRITEGTLRKLRSPLESPNQQSALPYHFSSIAELLDPAFLSPLRNLERDLYPALVLKGRIDSLSARLGSVLSEVFSWEFKERSGSFSDTGPTNVPLPQAAAFPFTAPLTLPSKAHAYTFRGAAIEPRPFPFERQALQAPYALSGKESGRSIKSLIGRALTYIFTLARSIFGWTSAAVAPKISVVFKRGT